MRRILKQNFMKLFCRKSTALLTNFSNKIVLQGSKVQRNLFTSVTACDPKRKSDSSTRWLRRHIKDPFVHEAAKDGYRCRSAYKLLELDDRFNFLKPGSSVDCGAAPGSWTQVALQRLSSNKKNATSSTVIAVDLLDIQNIPGAVVLDSSDFTMPYIQKKIKELLPQGQADVVISDMAPNATGNKRLDHSRIIDLNRSALEFVNCVLKVGGSFLCKVWDGNETSEFMDELSDVFSFSKQVKPKASRMDSSEFYIFSNGYFRQKT